LALGATSCGSSPEDDVKQALRQYLSAAREGDATKFCRHYLLVTDSNYLREDNQKALRRDARLTAVVCRELRPRWDKAVATHPQRFRRFRFHVDRIEVNGPRATATVTARAGLRHRWQTYRLIKLDETWRVYVLDEH
jgi:hypothetical protein